MVSNKAEAVQILQLSDKKNGFILNSKELQKILLADDVKDTFVTIVSVAGAYRKGKSFLLSFILRYLESVYETKNTSNWLGDSNTELSGFAWRGGAERHTTGMLIWPKLYQHTLPNGDKISIVLVDTQGTFDNKSTLQNCVTIFALSTMISSVQIYNIFHNIQEDDLQHLQLFTEYGKLAMSNNNQKPFQKLQFLIRDFGFPCDFEFGAAGGNAFLKKILEISDNQPQELKDIRKQINSYFDAIDCFLMPNPGKIVQKKEFKGKVKELDNDFIDCLKEFIPLVVGPDSLTPKKINGKCIKAKDLILYIQEYVDMFESDNLPSALNIFEATVKANNMSAIEESKQFYNKHMEPVCHVSKEYIPLNQLIGHHEDFMKQAKQMFEDKTQLGNEKQRRAYRDLLSSELDKLLNFYIAKNESKRSEDLSKMIENLQSEMSDSKNINAEYQGKLSNLTEQLIEMQKKNAEEQAELHKKLQEALNRPPQIIYQDRCVVQ